MSLRWSSYIAPKSPKGAQKRKSAVFPIKPHFFSRKYATKFLCCEYCQQQCCRAFIGLTIHAKIIGGDVPFYLKCKSTWPRWSEIAHFRSIFAHSASTVTPSEKSSINTNRKSYIRAFQWSQDEHRTLSLTALKGAPKRKNGRIRFKIAFRLKKFCWKVSLCENYQRQSCRAFIDRAIRAKMINGGRPLKLKFCVK